MNTFRLDLRRTMAEKRVIQQQPAGREGGWPGLPNLRPSRRLGGQDLPRRWVLWGALLLGVSLIGPGTVRGALDGPGESAGGAEADQKVVVLQGPGAEAWVKRLSVRGREASVIKTLEDCPAGAVLVLPDQFLNARELASLEALLQGPGIGRVLAMGQSAFTDGGPTAATSLKVGKAYYYVPILYPRRTEPGQGKYEQFLEAAKFCARQGANGLATFSYLYTTPAYWGQAGTDTLRRCFESFEDWKTRQRPTPLGVRATPKVLFLHTGDTWRIDAQGAARWAADLGCNTVQLTVSRFHFGKGMALYPSKFTAKTVLYKGKKEVPAENPTPTYLPDLIEACRKRNLDVWVNLFWGSTARPLPEDQRQVIQDGSRGIRPCPLSGAEHIDYLCDILEEVLAKYPAIRCVGLDEFHIRCRSWRTWGCFCPACKERFAEEYGYELKPETAILGWGKPGRQSLTDNFLEFRYRVMNEMVFEKLRRAINRVRPGLVMLEWAPRNYAVWGIDPVSAIRHGLQGYGPEYWNGPGTPGGYLNYPERFVPRREPIIALQGPVGKRQRKGSIVRVDCFDDAKVLCWGVSADRSRWPAMVESRGGKVRYCSFDPLAGQSPDEVLVDDLLDWACPKNPR